MAVPADGFGDSLQQKQKPRWSDRYFAKGGVAMKQRFGLAILGAVLVLAGVSANAGAQQTQRLAGGPMVAFPGEHAVTCVGNLSNVFLQFTFRIVQISGVPFGNNGGVTPSEETLDATSLSLPPLGSSATTPNPCVDVLIPTSPAAGAPSPRALAIMAILIAKPEVPGAAADVDVNLSRCHEANPQPLPPHVVATLEVLSLGTDGAPANIRVVPLQQVSRCGAPHA